jgi:tetraacyldisaccharide 4'-kinase
LELHLQAAWLTRGPMAMALAPVAWLYGAIVAVRKRLFSCRLRPSWQLPVPVVIVGNLIVGGAGKTPTVLAVLSLLKQHGFFPGVISRGYGGSARGVTEVSHESPATEVGDEPLLLRLRSQVPVVVGRDRVQAGRELLRRHPSVNVIVCDDGLQHLQLHRDLQVLVFDERGAGNGLLLPAGPLREPLPREIPPGTLVVYNAPRPSTPLPGTLARRRLSGVVELAGWRAGQPASLAALQSLAQHGGVLAAAGIARPQRFFDMLEAAGLQITPLPLPDHHDYATLPWPADATDVIVTEKDAVKLHSGRPGTTRVWVAPLDFETEDVFNAALIAALPYPLITRTDHGHPTA